MHYKSTIDGVSEKNWVSRRLLHMSSQTREVLAPESRRLGSLKSASASERALCYSDLSMRMGGGIMPALPYLKVVNPGVVCWGSWRPSAFTYKGRLGPHTPHPLVWKMCVYASSGRNSELSKRKVCLSLLCRVPMPQGLMWLPLLKGR